MRMLSTLCLSLLAAAHAACNHAAADHAPVPTAAPVAVPLTEVTTGATPDVLTLTGRLVADQRAEVTASTQGKVLAVMVERGQRVKRGDAVVQLDVKTASLSTREAAANLAAARTERELASQECARATSLLDQGAITRSEYDREHARCQSAMSQVSAAAARTSMLARTVSDGIVRAPFDGIVAERQVTPGEWVSPGRPLFTLVDADPLRIELSVPETSVSHVELGQAVALSTVSRAGQTFTATVSRVGAEIDRSRALIVEATIAPAADLVPGMFAEAEVVIGHTVRPIVPATAVIKRGKLWHAFVVVDGELEDRIVQLGPSPDAAHVSIIQNLAAGDRVVTTVTDDIVDGLKVQ
jgi:membrane fusion protein, multidrug efflux system